MKTKVLVMMMLAAVLPSCKTSEANYRAAYETVKAKENVTPMDSTIYSNIRKAAFPKTVMVGDVKLPMKVEYVSFSAQAGGDAADFRRYSVVVAQFRQIFNAKAMMKRVADAGYLHAFVVQTREPLYYVVAGSVDTPAEALELLEKLKKETRIPMKEPAPWVLRKS